MDNLDLIDQLLSLFDDINVEYSYLGLSDYGFGRIVLDVTKGNENQKYDILVEQIRNKLDEVTVEKLSNNEEAATIINNFIDGCINYNDVTNELYVFECLNSFFRKYDYTPKKDVLMSVLGKNKAFFELTVRLDNKYNSTISKSDFDKISNNSALVQTLQGFDSLSYKMFDMANENKAELSTDLVNTYMREMARYPLLTSEEEKEVLEKIALGDKNAKEKLINSNLRLVVAIAKKYLGRGVPLEDLIQEGNLGLIKSIDTFDVSRGNKFSTYSYWWIRQGVSRAVANTGKSIRIPVYAYEQMEKCHRIKNELALKINGIPTIEMIAEAMDIPVERAAFLDSLYTSSETTSLNDFINSDEKETELQDYIPSHEPTPEELVIDSSLRQQLYIAFDEANLSKREREILALRYGLNDGVSKRLEEVGRLYGVTRERIRQIEFKAIRKLKKPVVTRRLLPYTTNEKAAAQFVGLDISDGLKYTGTEAVRPRKKKKTIYDFFDYTKEEVEAVVERLSEEDKEVFEYMEQYYAGKAELNTKFYNRFYHTIRLKIDCCLRNPNYELRNQKERKTPAEDRLEEPAEVVTKEETFTKENYAGMLEVLKSTSFADFMNTLSPKEAVVLSLRLGYVDGKYFNKKSIADFLGIEEREVESITAKALLMYKDKFNNILDGVIDKVDNNLDDNKRLIKNRKF